MNNILYIIHKFINVVYEKTVYKNTIFVGKNLKKLKIKVYLFV